MQLRYITCILYINSKRLCTILCTFPYISDYIMTVFNITTFSGFEFICAQSPYNMRGLLIGIFFSIQGLFSLFSLLLQYTFSWHRVYDYPFQERTGLPCEFWCYLIFVLVSFIGLLVYFVISCKYKRRKREDFFDEVTMIEEYYSSGI